MDVGYYVPPRCTRLVSSVMDAFVGASERQFKEIDAACKIQSLYRMWRERCAYRRIRNAALNVQRLYRGHLDRRRVLETRALNAALHEGSVYEYYASLIQACFRGYYVRRYVDNFYARRSYVQMTVKASDAVREAAEVQLKEQQEREAAEKIRRRDLRYKRATEKLHYITSTLNCGGIYKRPTDISSATTIYGTCVEDDIRNGSKAVRRPQLETTVRNRLKMASVSARKERGEWGRRPPASQDLQQAGGDTGEKTDSMMYFTVTSGAWNRSGVKGCSLPPIRGPDEVDAVKCNVVSHCCIEDFLSTYDEEKLKIERSVDKKEIELAHKKQRFTVSASASL
ncbi:IQ calmodulin-binding motif containing protein, putative [Trypanosoma equiperdum]|uniref:IQ calmodulin-binding motif containing protein n=4 Tax=Trypanozoon TaxID=39700 RepID=Q383P4_TRYB2|nr:hypothetical protein, conserved [Trypanosoma brucei gambiense DAL972]XP_829099.1 hypothetical protein, conserved [Trypanosoma brucei brucei TREU927]RHW67771.1 IQ calmodulin-binding motif containing protein [Trypanosoma brucei equiperdum]SCU72781.1 IQ calmodulin-binding motif containing protein, putative [Trypanosoma equiperdum]EAN79987.1 hypothetical protein, conserved [Trypanosoma brucei brucei TREU927]CBH18042.1 hypothetical protein, conserved [Trypanosoma brucei gambiense DAL972]|eukprot:XP_011780306.1 hypothetical protein, conserved [Trypanosoma brucei gambiense DAL972]